MISGSLARRYARALMQIGIDQQTFEALGNELRSLAQAYRSSRELEATLRNPAFPRADREKILRAVLDVLGASEVIVNFTRLLLDRERVAAIPDISRELDAMIDEHIGRVAAVITSATPLGQNQKSMLIEALERLSGRTVSAETRHDPELLGGVVAQVGDMVYDGSLRTQLEQMRHRLAQ